MIQFLLAAATLAAPKFEPANEEDAAQAAAFWQAGVACAGWEAQAPDAVAIERDLEPGSWEGRAIADEEGLNLIRLTENASPATLAHEVAHAWFRHGDRAVTEGQADLLGACIVKRLPETVHFLAANRSSLSQMPDLRSWTSDEGLSRDAVDAAYIGSFRLFRAIHLVLGPKLLDRELSTWEAVEAALDADGSSRSRRIMRVLEGGVEKQRTALLDEDRDDLCELEELMLGTDAELWDSDGDGWWDGGPEEHPANVLPLPPDGSALCGLLRPKDGGAIKVTHHGFLRGYDLKSADVEHDEPNLMVSMSEKMMMHPGGIWFELGGDLEPNPRCFLTPRVTIAAGSDKVAEQLEPLARAVEAMLSETSERFGRPRNHRMVLQLKGLETDWAHQGIQHPIVLPLEHVLWASSPEQLNIVVAQVVAMHWLGYTNDPRTRSLAASVALARHLAPEASKHQISVAFSNDVRAWTKLAEKCEEGWAGVLRSDCVLE